LSEWSFAVFAKTRLELLIRFVASISEILDEMPDRGDRGLAIFCSHADVSEPFAEPETLTVDRVGYL